MAERQRDRVLAGIMSSGVVAVIRMKETDRLQKVIEAIHAGGVTSLEITMTVPGAIESIRALSKTLPGDALLGAGTVTDVASAGAAIDAGATFIVSPIFDRDVVALCARRDIAVMPGCYTPLEIFTAWSAGADVIKVFPATSLGPKYFKDLHGPFPDIRLMPTGGVTIDNVGEWVKAGAVAVGIGSDLLDKEAIAGGRYGELTDRAKRMVANFRKAKGA
jgi:2-dehydro-3-deoxyphosphogluconate aldolase / (4S)-4-hydroxy-2-oxoglutarate aldolase